MKPIFLLLLCGCGLHLFGEKPQVYPNRGEEYRQKVESVQLSDKAPGIRLSWENSPIGYAELFLRRPLPLGKLNGQTVIIPIAKRNPSTVRQVNLRVKDSSGEIFEYSPESPEDSTEAKYILNPSRFHSCWEGDGNRQPDGNMTISSFTVIFSKPYQSGSILLGMPLLAKTERETSCRKTIHLFQFNQKERWKMSRGSGKISTGADGTAVTVQGAGPWILEEHKRKIVSVTGFQSAQLEVDLLEGNAEVALEINGRNNRPRMMPRIPLKAGINRVPITVPESVLHVNQPLFRLGIYSKDSGRIRLFFRKLEAETRCRPLEEINVSLKTGSPFLMLYRKDVRKKLAVNFTNLGKKTRDLTANCRFTDFSGRALEKKINLVLNPGEEKTIPVNMDFPTIGHWRMSVQLEDNNKRETLLLENHAQFAVLRPETPSTGKNKFIFGVHSHPHRWSLKEQELEAQAAGILGVSVLRWGIPWAGLQKTKEGPWDFSQADAMVERFKRQNIEIAAILSLPPRWATSPDWKPVRKGSGGGRLPTDEGWRNYVRQTARHFKGRIRFYEQWNEPDLVGFVNFSWKDYIRIFKIGAKEIHASDPEAVVLSSGFSSMLPQVNSNTKNFVPEALAALKNDFDIQAHHEHGDYPHYKKIMDGPFAAVRKKTGIEKPWYANETAIHSAGRTDRRQAETLFKKLIFSWSRGAMGYNWYDLRNDGFSIHDNEQNFGLLTHDFQPKMAYAAYHALIRIYQGAEFRRELKAGDMESLLEFVTPSGKTLLAGWGDTPEHPVVFVLHTNAGEARMFDLMGNEKQIPVCQNTILFAPGNEPATLELPAGTSVSYAGELLRTKVTVPAIPGREMQFMLSLRNPFQTEQIFKFHFTPPKGISMREFITVTVPGKSMREQLVTADISFSFEKEAKLNAVCSLDGAGYRNSFSIPVRNAVRIPENVFHTAPDFRLNKRDDTVSLVGFDPATSHLIWTGPEDLSAEVRLRKTTDALEAEIKVTDDRHVQPYSGAKVWMGDNVQLAFQLPGQSGLWEIGLSRLDSGKSDVWIWSAGNEWKDTSGLRKQIALTTTRKGTQTIYDVRIPDSVTGLKKSMGKTGILFNILINDNDGSLREGWIQLAPGIGEEKNTDQYSLLVF